jgi:hypothetical protein
MKKILGILFLLPLSANTLNAQLTVPAGKLPGDILVWNGNDWVQLPAGDEGQLLMMKDGQPNWSNLFDLPSLSIDLSGSPTTTATFNVTVDNAGYSNVTGKGICWNTTGKPTKESADKTKNGAGTAPFTASVGDLKSNTTYYVRAYATNSVGTAYKQVVFTTAATITNSTVKYTGGNYAIGTGYVNETGNATLTARGLCWDTHPGPIPGPGRVRTTGNAVGSFTDTITNLKPGTTYYARAYAINDGGTAYGPEVSITVYARGSVRTNEVYYNQSTGICLISATFKDNGYNLQNAQKGICWSIAPHPRFSFAQGNGFLLAPTPWGTVSTKTPKLNPCYFRAFIATATDTIYGNEVFFDSNKINLFVAINDSIRIDQTTITCSEISNLKDTAETQLGMCWNTSGNPTLMDSAKAAVWTRRAVTIPVRELQPNTKYYVKAYLFDAKGILYYSDEKTFTSPGLVLPPPGVMCPTPESATYSGFYNGILNMKGFCWSTDPDPGLDDSYITLPLSGNNVTTVSELKPSTGYYVRAFATTGKDTFYSDARPFITPGVTVSVYLRSNITPSSADYTITTNTKYATAKGVCWSYKDSLSASVRNPEKAMIAANAFDAVKVENTIGAYYLKPFVTYEKDTIYGRAQLYNLLQLTNGYRYRDVSTQKVFIAVNGKLRWITSETSYFNLFTTWDGVIDLPSMTGYVIGPDISPLAVFASSSGNIFFAEGGDLLGIITNGLSIDEWKSKFSINLQPGPIDRKNTTVKGSFSMY